MGIVHIYMHLFEHYFRFSSRFAFLLDICFLLVLVMLSLSRDY